MKQAVKTILQALILLSVTSTLYCCDAILRLFPNEIPIADAGPDQVGVPVGSTVYLDGSASWDPDGNSLGFAWFFWDGPAVTTAVIYNYRSAHPYFTPDEPGTYVFLLIVDDGLEESRPDRIEITTS